MGLDLGLGSAFFEAAIDDKCDDHYYYHQTSKYNRKNDVLG
jgi:hypothetical protein